MSLLELQAVTKRYRSGQRELNVLNGIDLQVEPGELVVVWGPRRSGRSTLLRIAAGIETPDSGSVCLEGQPLGERSIGTGVGYVAKTLRANEEQGVLDQVAAVLLARGIGVRKAREHARTALERAGGTRCAAMGVAELRGAEALRVAIARTLALGPKVLVVDEPAEQLAGAEVALTLRDGQLHGPRRDQGATVLALRRRG
jgi:predicted ABC-type transport system involved in lysophospholipase L1 biosynthesis ATPase subunit